MEKHIEATLLCSGCAACFHICPSRAITMTLDREGFLYPAIDEKCTDCGLCLKICPALAPPLANKAKPTCFAAFASDELRLSGSSSGAIFPVLAKYFLERGGLVCGAAFNNDFTKLEHRLIGSEDNLQPLKGSKYLASDVQKCYQPIEDALKSGKEVLFSGTPCQVAGIKAAFAKYSGQLFTIDLICHGVLPPKLFNKFIADTFPGETIQSVNFRYKPQGQGSLYTRVVHNDKTYLKLYSIDGYMKTFLLGGDVFLRPSCTRCRFAGLSRPADLTLGDFWGYKRIGRKSKYLNDGKGLSAVLANSAKGMDILKTLEGRFKTIQKVRLSAAVRGNRNLRMPTAEPRARRATFFELLDSSLPFSKLADYSTQNWCDVIILNYWFADNYGANLTAYALQETVKSFGLTTKHVTCYSNKPTPGGHADVFARKYLDTLDNRLTHKEVYALNDVADTFIVGSDQVWRYRFSQEYNNAHFLGFVDDDKKKIACAASFGRDCLEGDHATQMEMAEKIRRFDHISVREDSAVEMCESNFGLSATHLQDPVFALTAADYDKIIRNSQRREQNFILSYFLPKKQTRENAERAEAFLSNYFNRPAISVPPQSRSQYSNEDWLYMIKNCDFMLTDSFHGAAFAIIFNRPFFVISRLEGGDARLFSLLAALGLKDRFLTKATDIQNPGLLEKAIDYARVNEIIAAEGKRLKNWLWEAIKSPKSVDKHTQAAIRANRETTMRLLELEEYNSLSLRKHRLLFDYYRSRVLCVITRGKKQKKYMDKRMQCKTLLKRLRFLGKQLHGKTRP